MRGKYNFTSRLYLAAYNMGASNLTRALGRKQLPQEYATRVMKRYVNFYAQMRSGLARQGELVAAMDF